MSTEDKMTQEVMQEFMSTFHFLMRFNCFPSIDEMFKKMINEDWSKESFETNKGLIVLFCRTNYSYREKLNNYQAFLDKSIKYLEDNNYEPKKLLHGII